MALGEFDVVKAFPIRFCEGWIFLWTTFTSGSRRMKQSVI
jgi:hypothetical protein